MKARKNVYDLLRCLFLQEPTPVFLDALQKESLLGNLKGCHPDLDEGIEILEAVLSTPDLSKEASRLTEEFTRLFIGPFSIPLCESQYRGLNGLKTPKSFQPVQKKYLMAGVCPDPRQFLPADHIGAELEFIYFLCQQVLQMSKDKSFKPLLRLQQSFFEDHLNAWVPALCARLYQEAQSPYFKGLAKMTQGFIAWDYQEIVAHFGDED